MAQSPNHPGACWRQYCQCCARQIADCGCSGQYGDWETRRTDERGIRCQGIVGEYVPDPPANVPVKPAGGF